MKKIPIATAVLILLASNVFANSAELQAGESFVKARTRLVAAGWQADSRAHLSSGEYIGLDRLLVQGGYSEVDYCSVGKSLCVFQYIKGEACLRVHTQGEQILSMKVEHWSNDCRERGTDEPSEVPPADVRYLAQWRSDCEKFGRCGGINSFLLKLKKKYRQDHEIMTMLNAYKFSGEAK